MHCRLVAGSDVDSTRLIESQPGTIDNVQPAALAAWTQFGPGGGDLSVRCATDGFTGDVVSRFLKITAMKAGSLEIEPLT